MTHHPSSKVTKDSKEGLLLKASQLFEDIGLVGMILCLPLFESPTTGFLILAISGFLMKRVLVKKWNLHTGPFGRGLLVFWAATVLSGLAAPNIGTGLGGAWDVFRFASIYFILSVDFKNPKRLFILLWILVIGTLIGVLWGFAELSLDPNQTVMRLRNVGNGNHSGFFIAQVLCVVSGMIAYSYTNNLRYKILVYLIFVILLAGLFFTESRSAFIGFALFIGYLFAVSAPKSRRRFALVALSSFMIFMVLIAISPSLREKMSNTESFQFRYHFWRAALLAYEENPIVGLGPDHFDHIEFERYGTPEKYRYSHPHSIWFKVLSELGTVGAIAFSYMIWTFVRQFHPFGPPPEDGESSIFRCGSTGAMIVILGGGLFNTTLHHETAMVFTLLIGFHGAWQMHRETIENEQEST